MEHDDTGPRLGMSNVCTHAKNLGNWRHRRAGAP